MAFCADFRVRSINGSRDGSCAVGVAASVSTQLLEGRTSSPTQFATAIYGNCPNAIRGACGRSYLFCKTYGVVGVLAVWSIDTREPVASQSKCGWFRLARDGDRLAGRDAEAGARRHRARHAAALVATRIGCCCGPTSQRAYELRPCANDPCRTSKHRTYVHLRLSIFGAMRMSRVRKDQGEFRVPNRSVARIARLSEYQALTLQP